MTISLVGCNKDDSSGSITLEQSGIYVDDYGSTTFTTFETDNVGDVSVYLRPLGWTVSVSNSDNTVSVTAPQDITGVDLDGTVYLSADTPDGTTKYAYLSVGIVDFIEIDDISNGGLDDQQANSMIVTTPNRFYSFDPYRRGESSERQDFAIDDVRIEWRSANAPVTNVRLMEDDDYGLRIGFFVPYDEYDLDDDGDDEDVIEGNAVISILDEKEVVLWSWHIWVSDDDVSEISVGGATFMDRNLGAYANDNTDEDTILESYGLYYQWGRKDPFARPQYYNASGSVDAYMYDKDGSIVQHGYDNSTVLTGSVLYSYRNPRSFINGTPSSNFDWLYGSMQNDSLWDDNGQKSIYDPSPKGWRVPSSAQLALLGEADGYDSSENIDDVMEYFGTTFGSDFFMAVGMRNYYDGKIHNLSGDGSYYRWSGCYWSRDSAPDGDSGEKMASALYFYLNSADMSVTTESAASHYRANGMQIRCVKIE